MRVLIICLISGTMAWNDPSFISSWEAINSQDPSELTKTISHSLGEYPAMVEVQIRVNIAGTECIFTGAGAPQRDDDYNVAYGGVIYIYNDLHIKLAFPYRSGGTETYNTGGVVFTGSSTEYNGPTASMYKRSNDGFVRVRLWKLSDFPTPMFTQYTWISSRPADSFKQIDFNAGVYPDLVTVQTRLYQDSSTYSGWVSDGQGAVFQATTNSRKRLVSGVVFGYDENKVRLWVPIDDPNKDGNGAVYATEDGWVPDELFDFGNVTVRGYTFPPGNRVFNYKMNAGTSIASNNIVTVPSSLTDSHLISVQVKVDASDSNNPGMLFYGAGSAQSTGVSKYGGIIYAHEQNTVFLWTPKSGRGHMVYVADRWGGGQQSTVATSADIIIRIYADATQCDQPENVTNSDYTVTTLDSGGTVTYACRLPYTYGTGNLVRTCGNNGNWTGSLPTCVCGASPVTCGTPVPVPYSTYVASGSGIGDTVTYQCDTDYYLAQGTLTSTCEINGTWTGTAPACWPSGCPVPDPVDNASNTTSTALRSNSMYSTGTVVTYTCLSGYDMIGSSSRTCQRGGYWNGLPPFCTEIRCPIPDLIGNGSYTPSTSVYLPASVITYQCNTGYQMTGGSVQRTCTNSGLWDGVPPFCAVISCPIPDPLGNGSFTPATSVYLPNSVITYQCNAGYQMTGGSVQRTCTNSGLWDGVPPVCIETRCVDPGIVANTSYTVNGLHPTNTAVYVCNGGTSPTAGNLVRTCQSDGTWDGVPVVCGSSSCTSNPYVTYTDEDIARMVLELVKNLTINYKSTSAYYRSKNSARDDRKSSSYIGTAWMVALCTVMGIFILPDCVGLTRHMRNYNSMFRQN